MPQPGRLLRGASTSPACVGWGAALQEPHHSHFEACQARGTVIASQIHPPPTSESARSPAGTRHGGSHFLLPPAVTEQRSDREQPRGRKSPRGETATSSPIRQVPAEHLLAAEITPKGGAPPSSSGWWHTDAHLEGTVGHHGPALHQGPAHPGAAPHTALPALQISPGKEAFCWVLSGWKPPLRWGLLAGLGEPQVPRSVALRWDKPHSLQGAKYSRKRAGTQGLASPNPISLGKSTGSLCTTSSGRHRSRHQSPDAPRSPHYAQPHSPSGLTSRSACL